MGCNLSCVYLVNCVSRIQLRMSVAMDVRCATYGVRLAMEHVEEYVLCLQL